jgi:glycerol uptake facilitator-like aquaporin
MSPNPPASRGGWYNGDDGNAPAAMILSFLSAYAQISTFLAAHRHFLGAGAANLMFGYPVLFASHRARQGNAQLLSELIATFGLLSVIWGCSRRRSEAVPFAVGAYITAAYWFTSSTSFANPAVTLARAASDTFAGIQAQDVPGFIAAQFLGGAAATLLFRWLTPQLPKATPPS